MEASGAAPPSAAPPRRVRLRSEASLPSTSGTATGTQQLPGNLQVKLLRQRSRSNGYGLKNRSWPAPRRPQVMFTLLRGERLMWAERLEAYSQEEA